MVAVFNKSVVYSCSCTVACKVQYNNKISRACLINYNYTFQKIPDIDRFETMMLYPDKMIENMERNFVTGSIYLAAVKRVVNVEKK